MNQLHSRNHIFVHYCTLYIYLHKRKCTYNFHTYIVIIIIIIIIIIQVKIQAKQIKHARMKQKLGEKYLNRTKSILKAKLNGKK